MLIDRLPPPSPLYIASQSTYSLAFNIMAAATQMRDEVAHFIRDLYHYYVRAFTPTPNAPNSLPALPTPPIKISTVLVEECHAVAAHLARAARNKCAPGPRL